MSAPDYRERAPVAALGDYVRCVWTFEGPASDTPQPIAPDGCCELIVHRAEPYSELVAETYRLQRPVFFAGQLTAPLTLLAREPVAVIGVRFQPWAARAFLGVNADRATDQRLDLEALHGATVSALLREVREAPSLEAAAVITEAYVVERVRGVALNVDVRATVEAMQEEKEPTSPDATSERQWQRRFKAEVGVSERQLQSVLRFRRVFDVIEGPGPLGWVEAALAAGYFDQPQMARDFRRYLGVSSRQWAAQKLGLAKALTVSQTYKNEGGGTR